MYENFAENFFNFLDDEQNLHYLRKKLFNLDGYLLKSYFDRELFELAAKHDREIQVLRDNHEREIQDLKRDHEIELERANQKFLDYRADTEKILHQAELNASELERWRSDYGELSAVCEIFSELNVEHREAIAGIFGGCDSPADFLCGAVQKGHLEQLWDYIRDELATNATDESEDERLSALFDFSFAAVNRSQRELLYVRLAVPQGAKFDGDIMSRTPESPQLGRVKRSVFDGFRHAVTGKIVKRSLVSLE